MKKKKTTKKKKGEMEAWGVAIHLPHRWEKGPIRAMKNHRSVMKNASLAPGDRASRDHKGSLVSLLPSPRRTRLTHFLFLVVVYRSNTITGHFEPDLGSGGGGIAFGLVGRGRGGRLWEEFVFGEIMKQEVKKKKNQLEMVA